MVALVLAFKTNNESNLFHIKRYLRSDLIRCHSISNVTVGEQLGRHRNLSMNDEDLLETGAADEGDLVGGDPFRPRSRSAPPALWAAKKYGRQLRRMSDEFDILLDKGVRKPNSIKNSDQHAR